MQVLHPGDVACAVRGERLETLLGSCVAIVLTDSRRTLGVMCHIVHSRSLGVPRHARSGAHADIAWQSMQAMLRARAVDPAHCEAFAYGGGNMFPTLFSQTHVGLDNAEWALQVLATSGIPLLHQDLGGARYRRLAWTVGDALPQVTAVPI